MIHCISEKQMHSIPIWYLNSFFPSVFSLQFFFLHFSSLKLYRNHYMCTVYAAKMMVPRKSGLIVNISSAGGLAYLFNVAYGIGKEAVSPCCQNILQMDKTCC